MTEGVIQKSDMGNPISQHDETWSVSVAMTNGTWSGATIIQGSRLVIAGRIMQLLDECDALTVAKEKPAVELTPRRATQPHP